MAATGDKLARLFGRSNVGRNLLLDDLAVGCGKVDRRADVTRTQIELVGQGGHRMLGLPVVWRRRACSCRDSRERGVPSGHSATRHWDAARCPARSVGVESVRRLSAVSRRTSGSTSACWSTWSSLTSANGIVPQSLPSEKRKVAGSIPALATKMFLQHRRLSHADAYPQCANSHLAMGPKGARI
jgi:hypothetical protein